MRLALQPQRSTATSLDEVLAKLNLTAHEDTKSNDLIQGYDFAANLRTDVVLVDRNKTHYIILHYGETGQQLNYRQQPASLLQLNSNSEADLVALLCLVYEHQDRNQIAHHCCRSCNSWNSESGGKGFMIHSLPTLHLPSSSSAGAAAAGLAATPTSL
jgi:hypothetical protein